MSDTPIIYVVDDDLDTRESACALVSQMGLQVEAFASAEDFLASYAGYRPGCLLTDHRMLGMTGVELLERLRENAVTLSVIVMTAFAETELTVRAVRGGAVTVIEKPFSDDVLWNAIQQALSEDRSRHADEVLKKEIREKLNTLTASETEVMKLVVRGEPNKSVAFALGVSVRTVENRRHSIFEKLNVTSVAELVRLVMTADSNQP